MSSFSDLIFGYNTSSIDYVKSIQGSVFFVLERLGLSHVFIFVAYLCCMCYPGQIVIMNSPIFGI